ncbi:MAG: PD-(D/E)XK nuclease family protein [Planctomycetota bacterium]|nr:PD-(D/E)XK nuclease family protein [Planctomycetota bacterium]
MTAPKAWSYSALSTYVSVCTLKYFFRYVANLEPERSFSRMYFGLAIHAGLEAAYRAWKPDAPAPVGVAKKVFMDDLTIRLEDPMIEFKKGETPEGLLTEGMAVLDVWAKEARYEEIISTESEFTVPLVHPGTGEIFERGLKGWFDLVVKDPDTGEPVVVDFKTTARRFSGDKLEADLQIRVYSYAIRQLYGLDRANLRLDVLVRNKKPVFQRLEVSQDSEGDARLFELVRAAGRGVEAGVFWPNDGSIWCGGCPFTQACARWHDNPDALRSHSEK